MEFIRSAYKVQQVGCLLPLSSLHNSLNILRQRLFSYVVRKYITVSQQCPLLGKLGIKENKVIPDSSLAENQRAE